MNIFEQGLLKYYSPEQLAIIQSQRIGLGGAGGLGSNLAVILTRSGFRQFEIIDSDRIEASNLNRQHFFLADIGGEKGRVLKSCLQRINPDIQVETHTVRWQPETGALYFHDCGFVVEAFDQANNKYDFVSFYQSRHPYIISGNGMAGLTEKSAIGVKKMGNVFLVGDLVTDVVQGHPPLAPRVTACAALMAEVILDLTLGIK